MLEQHNKLGLTEAEIQILSSGGTYLFDIDAAPLLERDLIELSHREDRFEDHYQATATGLKLLELQ